MTNENSKNKFLVLLIAVAFAYFTFGAITNVTGAIVPKIKESYDVSGSASTLLASVFFIAYGLMSVPFGALITKKGKKFTLIIGSGITTFGVLLFASVPGYFANMVAIFICGIGITAIQVAANPLVKDISDPKKYSRNLTLFMVLFGVGSYAAPNVVTFVKANNMHWTFTYWIFTCISILMLISLAAPKYPDEKSEDGEGKSDAKYIDLLKQPLMLMYALAIFLYVGVEVGIANNIGLFLEDLYSITEVLGDKAEGAKNAAVGNYWFGLMLGRLAGGVVLDKLPAKRAIQIFITGAACALAAGLFSGNINIALWSFPAIGFFISIMFPSIYTLAMDSFDAKYSGIISGILCTAILGGAVVGPVITKVAEIFGSVETPNWVAGMMVAFACYFYIFTVGIWAKPKTSN